MAKSVSPMSLGATIIEYSPYRRGRLAVQFLFAGSGAAALWFLMKWIEPSVFIPLLALVAVPLSLYCVSVFFRLLAPGRRISIRERGIVVGRKAFPWTEIDKVTYRLNTGTSAEPVPRQSHEFTFHLAGQDRLETLSVEEDFLPPHVDIQELLGQLRGRVQEIDLLDEPKVRKDQLRKTSPKVDLNHFIRIQADAEKTIQEFSGEPLSPRVIRALQDGELRRKLLSKIHRRAALITGAGSVVAATVTIAAVLTAFIGGIAILFQAAADMGIGTFDLFDLFDIPGGAVRYGLLAAVIAGAWWSAVKMENLAQRLRKKTRQNVSTAHALKPLKNGSQAEDFMSLVKSGSPFGLYLRSFTEEYLQYIERPLATRSEYELPIDYEIVERDFDVMLAGAIEGAMPVFALANVQDPSVSRKLKLLCVTDEHWLIVASGLIRSAAAVVVCVARVTDSLLLELCVLDKLALHDKTVLILGKEFVSEPLSAPEKELLFRFSRRFSEADAAWQDRVRQHVHVTRLLSR